MRRTRIVEAAEMAHGILPAGQSKGDILYAKPLTLPGTPQMEIARGIQSSIASPERTHIDGWTIKYRIRASFGLRVSHASYAAVICFIQVSNFPCRRFCSVASAFSSAFFNRACSSFPGTMMIGPQGYFITYSFVLQQMIIFMNTWSD